MRDRPAVQLMPVTGRPVVQQCGDYREEKPGRVGQQAAKSGRLRNTFHFCKGFQVFCHVVSVVSVKGPIENSVPAALLWMQVRENTGSPLHHSAAHKPLNGKEAGQHAMSKVPPLSTYFVPMLN